MSDTNWGAWVFIALGVAGIAWIARDTIRERRKLRQLSLDRLRAPMSKTFAEADALARREALRTGRPHHAKLTTRGRWVVVAMEEERDAG